MLPRAADDAGAGACDVGGRCIDFFVAAAALAGRMGVEEILVDAPLHPRRPVRLEVTAGGEPALVPTLDAPAPFLGLDDPLPAGQRPSGGRA